MIFNGTSISHHQASLLWSQGHFLLAQSAFLRHQHLWVQFKSQNGPKKKELYSETGRSILINGGYSMREIARKLKDLINGVNYSLKITAQSGSDYNRKSNGRTKCTTEQEDKYIRGSSLRNRRLSGPRWAASLGGSRKVSVSTEKRRLRDAEAEKQRQSRKRTITGKEHKQSLKDRIVVLSNTCCYERFDI